MLFSQDTKGSYIIAGSPIHQTRCRTWNIRAHTQNAPHTPSRWYDTQLLFFKGWKSMNASALSALTHRYRQPLSYPPIIRKSPDTRACVRWRADGRDGTYNRWRVYVWRYVCVMIDSTPGVLSAYDYTQMFAVKFTCRACACFMIYSVRTHLIDVFEFVYDLAYDGLGRFLSGFWSVRVGFFQAWTRKPVKQIIKYRI